MALRQPPLLQCTIAARGSATAGKGVVLVDGRLIENLHVENARRLLALADEIERLSGEK
jgi:citrate lyase subunit beta/citryl-CoA lyase